MSGNWIESPLPSQVARQVQPETKLYWQNVEDGQLRVMVSPPFSGQGWHLSISHAIAVIGPSGSPIAGRYPSWDEIRDARYDLLPDEITVGILLPPKAEYVNLHPTTFHLHEVEGAKR